MQRRGTIDEHVSAECKTDAKGPEGSKESNIISAGTPE